MSETETKLNYFKLILINLHENIPIKKSTLSLKKVLNQ